MRGETGQNITLVISTSQGHGSTQNLGFCMVSTHPWSQPNRNHLMCQSKCARHPPFAIAVQISPHSQHWLTGSLAPFDRNLFMAETQKREGAKCRQNILRENTRDAAAGTN